MNWPQRTATQWPTILHDLIKAFDHVAYQKLIDAAVRTRFTVTQLKLLLQLYQARRRVELDSVGGDALEAQRGIIPGCAVATALLQLLLVGPLREVRSAHPTVSIRVVVDDLSLQRCGDHNRVAHELGLASTRTASELTQAGNSDQEVQGPQQLSFWAGKAAVAVSSSRRAGNAGRPELRK